MNRWHFPLLHLSWYWLCLIILCSGSLRKSILDPSPSLVPDEERDCFTVIFRNTQNYGNQNSSNGLSTARNSAHKQEILDLCSSKLTWCAPENGKRFLTNFKVSLENPRVAKICLNFLIPDNKSNRTHLCQTNCQKLSWNANIENTGSQGLALEGRELMIEEFL